MKIKFYALLLLLSFGACKKESKAENAVAMEAAAIPEADKTTTADANTTLQPSNLKIIKTGSLRFETTDLQQTGTQVNNAVKQYNALVQSDVQTNDASSLGRTIVVRIAPQYFEAFIAEVGKGVNHFDRKDVSAEDVTEEYVDVEARIKAKKILEERYFDLLKKANKISEMLLIEKELATIREEIEAQQGRLKFLQNRVAQSTVTIDFYKKQDVILGSTESYGSKMRDALKSGFNGLSSFFLGLLYMWPIILIFVIVYIVYRKKIKKKRNTNA